MAIVSNNKNPGSESTQPTDASRRDRRPAHAEPSPSEVMSEAAAIYPDTSEAPPTPEQIAAEAYAIYLERGGDHGYDQEDWFEAERRLNQRRRKGSTG